MLVNLEHRLHASTIEIYSCDDGLEDVTEDFGGFEKLNISVVYLEIFSETEENVFVNFSLHGLLLSVFF
jgi:hypothetical protein